MLDARRRQPGGEEREHDRRERAAEHDLQDAKLTVVNGPAVTWLAPGAGACAATTRAAARARERRRGRSPRSRFFDGERRSATVKKRRRRPLRRRLEDERPRQGPPRAARRRDRRRRPDRDGDAHRPRLLGDERRAADRSRHRRRRRGIGAAIARALAARGWRCVLLARREERLRKLAEEIGGEAEVCDVGRPRGRRPRRRRGARAPSEDRPARQQRRHPRPDGLRRRRPRADRARHARELPRQRLVPARVPARPARARHAVRRREHRLRRRHRHCRHVRPVRRLEARAARVLARDGRRARSARGPRPLVMPGFVETEGFPQRDVFPRIVHPVIAEPKDIADAVLKALDQQPARDLRALVLPPRGAGAGALPGAVARSAASGRLRKPAEVDFDHRGGFG